MEQNVTFPFRLSFSEAEFTSELNRIRFAKDYAEKKMQEVTAINGLTITDPLFKDFMTGNGDAMAYALHQHTEKKMQQAGLSSMHSIIESAQSEDRKKFLAIRQHHTSKPEAFYLKYEDGEVLIDDYKVSELRERYTVYLHTQKAYDLYQLHVSLTETYNDMVALCPRMAQVNISNLFGRNYTGNLNYNWIADGN